MSESVQRAFDQAARDYDRTRRKLILCFDDFYRAAIGALPYSSLGPGIPEPPADLPLRLQRHRRRFDRPTSVVARSVLNALHHEYRPMARAA
jgi:hypothetical protein